MRTIKEHALGPGGLQLEAVDAVGYGNANHQYLVTFPPNTPGEITAYRIPFQNGPIAEVGVNGLTNEVLLAIVADRLRGFQKGLFACKPNACALTHIEEALHWLQQRTIERMQRGVEGTHVI